MRDKIFRFVREPLVQFLVIGIALFSIDQYVLGNVDDPRSIVIDDMRRTTLIEIFREGQGRLPSEDELDKLVVKWTQNEILYREARLMGLDKGDEMIRQRLILKMRNILFSNITSELPNEQELKDWFEQNRGVYDAPELYNFEQFQIAASDNTASTESIAHKLAIELHNQAQPEEYNKSLRRYRKRPGVNLTSVFRKEYAQMLLEAEDKRWVAVKSSHGWHVARITQRYPAQPANFEQVRSKVVNDWKAANERLELAKTVKEIADQYELKLEFEQRDPVLVDEQPKTAKHQRQTAAQEQIAQK